MKQAKKNSKQKAYEKKIEQKGVNVVAWIFGVLIACAVLYAVLSVFMFD